MHILSYSTLNQYPYFLDPLKVIFSLVLLYLFYSLMCNITPLSGFLIHNHPNNNLINPSDNKSMLDIGVITTYMWYLLSIHITCNGNLSCFLSSDRSHHYTHDWLSFANVVLIYIWRTYLISKTLTSCM